MRRSWPLLSLTMMCLVSTCSNSRTNDVRRSSDDQRDNFPSQNGPTSHVGRNRGIPSWIGHGQDLLPDPSPLDPTKQADPNGGDRALVRRQGDDQLPQFLEVQRTLSQEWLELPCHVGESFGQLDSSQTAQQKPFSHGIWESIEKTAPLTSQSAPASEVLYPTPVEAAAAPVSKEIVKSKLVVVEPVLLEQSRTVPKKNRTFGRPRRVAAKCTHEGCTRQPSFAEEGSKTAKSVSPVFVSASARCSVLPPAPCDAVVTRRTCALHKEASHVDIINGHCGFAGGCNRSAVFGSPNGSRAQRFCRVHRCPEHVNLRSRRCTAPGCYSQPLYGNEGGRAVRCGKHKEAGHCLISARRCSAAGCLKLPTYGPSDEWTPRRCRAHRAASDVLVIGRRCTAVLCTRRALYGPEGGKPTCCPAHRSTDHVDLHTPRCRHEGCRRQALFGVKGGRKATCGQHRTAGMINLAVRRRLCRFPGCEKRATYGDGASKALMCADHARTTLEASNSSSLFNVVKKRCQHPEGCRRHPSFGLEEDGRPLVCKRHKHHEHVFLPALANWRCTAPHCQRCLALSCVLLRCCFPP